MSKRIALGISTCLIVTAMTLGVAQIARAGDQVCAGYDYNLPVAGHKTDEKCQITPLENPIVATPSADANPYYVKVWVEVPMS